MTRSVEDPVGFKQRQSGGPMGYDDDYQELVEKIENDPDVDIDPDATIWEDEPVGTVRHDQENDRLLAVDPSCAAPFWAVRDSVDTRKLVQCDADECETYMHRNHPPDGENRCPACSNADITGYVYVIDERGGSR